MRRFVLVASAIGLASCLTTSGTPETFAPPTTVPFVKEALYQLLRGDPRYLGLSGTDPVKVLLRADGEPLASRLIDTYGDQIEVKVGNFEYPLTSDRSNEVACVGVPTYEPSPLPDGVEIAVPGQHTRRDGT